jgi:hypothetical protein
MSANAAWLMMGQGSNRHAVHSGLDVSLVAAEVNEGEDCNLAF